MTPKPETGITCLFMFPYFGRCPAAVSSLMFVIAAAFCLFPLIVVAVARG